MSHPSTLPDPLPLREVLRGLRHGMRRSRRALRETARADALPGPAAALAGPLLDGLDTLAGGLDAAGTDLAKRFLGGRAGDVPPFGALMADPRQDELFAAACYGALRRALRRMGADAFVSEAAARRAFGAVAGRLDRVRDTVAAELALALVAAEAVRDVAAGPKVRVVLGQVAPVAVTAAVLWLLADRDGAGEGDVSDAAVDIACALADELAPLVATRDRAGLARLLGTWAPHV